MTGPVRPPSPASGDGAPCSPANDVRAGQIIEAAQDDLDAVSQLIAEAFHPLAPSQWLASGPDARRDILPRVFRLYAEDAWADGLIHLTAGRTAAALWLPVSADGPGAPPDYTARLTAATPGWTDRFAMFGHLLQSCHPVGVSHYHLAILAVRPGWQGQGLGSVLLRHQHQALDLIGMAAYLEASDQRTRRLYLSCGYADHGPPIRLPQGPRMFPMWRDPATAAPAGAQPEGT